MEISGLTDVESIRLARFYKFILNVLGAAEIFASIQNIPMEFVELAQSHLKHCQQCQEALQEALKEHREVSNIKPTAADIADAEAEAQKLLAEFRELDQIKEMAGEDFSFNVQEEQERQQSSEKWVKKLRGLFNKHLQSIDL